MLVKKCSEMASEFVQILKNPGEQTQYLNSTSLDLSWGGILRDLKSQIERQIMIIYFNEISLIQFVIDKEWKVS